MSRLSTPRNDGTADLANPHSTYGPQAPTAFCNGPTCAKVQGDWIVGVIAYMASKGLQSVEADRQSEEAWRQTVLDMANASLMPTTKSVRHDRILSPIGPRGSVTDFWKWYMGDNIPGKPREPLLWLGGVPAYYKVLNDTADSGYSGFTFRG